MTDHCTHPSYMPPVDTFAEHIRTRPGMHIGKLGNGSCAHDGIYLLVKYALDSVLETTPVENTICINNTSKSISIDWKLAECPDSFFPKADILQPFHSSGYMISAIAALSSNYVLEIPADKYSAVRRVTYERGYISSDETIKAASIKNTVSMMFTPDELVFDKDFNFRDEFINDYIQKNSTVNPEIKFIYNGTEIFSPHGMKDFIEWKFDGLLLPTIHLVGEGIDLAINATKNLNSKTINQYASFNNEWNGDYFNPETRSFIASIVTTLNNYYGCMLQQADEEDHEEFYMYEKKLPGNLVGALWMKIDDPLYISCQKTTLGSKWLDKEKTVTIEDFVSKFIETELPKYLNANQEIARNLKEVLNSSITKCAGSDS